MAKKTKTQEAFETGFDAALACASDIKIGDVRKASAKSAKELKSMSDDHKGGYAQAVADMKNLFLTWATNAPDETGVRPIFAPKDPA